jgi:anti-sigma-K factor RskA
MTHFSDEILMAYADGELDPDTSVQVQAAMAGDADMARRVARHRTMRDDVYASFAPILDEAVPQRLSDALRQAQPAPAFAPRPAANQNRWSLPAWGALAASLVVGVLIGKMALPLFESGHRQGAPADAVATIDGQVTAGGALARALSQQLASAPGQGQPVSIGITFRAADGQFCRSFTLHDGGRQASALAGLACKAPEAGDRWIIPVLMETRPDKTAPATYRMAGSAAPAILQAIDERIAGQPLDAAAERQALQRNWRP